MCKARLSYYGSEGLAGLAAWKAAQLGLEARGATVLGKCRPRGEGSPKSLGEETLLDPIY